MNELQIFENPMFGAIRTLKDGGKVLFCAKDIADKSMRGGNNGLRTDATN